MSDRNHILYVIRDAIRPFLTSRDREVLNYLIGNTQHWTTYERISISIFLDLPRMMGDTVETMVSSYKSMKNRFVFTECLKMAVKYGSDRWIDVLRSCMKRDELASAHKILPNQNFLMKYYSWNDVFNRLLSGQEFPFIPHLMKARHGVEFTHEFQRTESKSLHTIVTNAVDQGFVSEWWDLTPANRKDDVALIMVEYLITHETSDEQFLLVLNLIPEELWPWIGLELRSRDEWPPEFLQTLSPKKVAPLWNKIGDDPVKLYRMFKNRPKNIRRELADRLERLKF